MGRDQENGRRKHRRREGKDGVKRREEKIKKT
jgi:hypothetical protein